jgi:hypothetical protein
MIAYIAHTMMVGSGHRQELQRHSYQNERQTAWYGVYYSLERGFRDLA